MPEILQDFEAQCAATEARMKGFEDGVQAVFSRELLLLES
jgi:hypothetical protein